MASANCIKRVTGFLMGKIFIFIVKLTCVFSGAGEKTLVTLLLKAIFVANTTVLSGHFLLLPLFGVPARRH